MLPWYAALITIRRSLPGIVSDEWDAAIERDGSVVVLRRPTITVACNLGRGPVARAAVSGTPLLRWPPETPDAAEALAAQPVGPRADPLSSVVAPA